MPNWQVTLQDVCEEIVDGADGALGCALVDLATGLPVALDVKPNALVSATAMELLSVAGFTYFSQTLAESPTSSSSVAKDHGQERFVRELQATTEDAYLFMSVVPGNEQELLILITDRRFSNLGLGWMAMRQALDLVSHAVGNDSGEPSDVQTANPLAMRAVPQQPEPESTFPHVQGRRTIWGRR